MDAWAEQNLTQFIIKPKASKSEREKNLSELEYGDGGGISGIQDQSLLTGSGNVRDNKRKNIHPSVKPLSVISYLIKLSTREGDTILDPFLGSGTTMIASRNEKRNCIGIEREAQYIKIIKGRLEWSAMQKMGIECEFKGEQ